MDIITVEERSLNMSKIKNSRTQPEMYIRSLLHCRGLRFRVNYSKIQGKPDLYFSKKKVAIFVHGCFWHHHNGCPFAYTPKSNVEFWQNKLVGNQLRDEKVLSSLHQQGIRTIIFWECSVEKMQKDYSIEDQYFLLVKNFIFNENTINSIEI